MKKPTKELLELGKIADTDRAVSEWFKSIGNKRTISNYRNDFPKFLKFIREHTSFKTPSGIIEQRRKDLQSQDPCLRINPGHQLFTSFMVLPAHP